MLIGVLLLSRVWVRIYTLRTRISYDPHRFCAQGSIRFGYRDPSVRPSNSLAREVRIVGPASGSFATKSEWASATVSLHRRNFVPYSGVTSARRASKISNVFFQDSCIAFVVSGVGPAVTGCHKPREVSQDGCIPPYAYPEPACSTLPTPNRRGYSVLSGQAPSDRGSCTERRDERDS